MVLCYVARFYKFVGWLVMVSIDEGIFESLFIFLKWNICLFLYVTVRVILFIYLRTDHTMLQSERRVNNPRWHLAWSAARWDVAG